MGFSYRGIHSDMYDIEFIPAIGRNIGTPTRDRDLAVTGGLGRYPAGQDDDARIIPVTFQIHADSEAALREKYYDIGGWLSTIKDRNNKPLPQEIVFDDDPTRRWMGYPRGQIEAPETFTHANCTVTFFIPGGYAETITPKTSPRTGTNHGTAPTPVKITVTVDTATGEAFFLDETFFIEPLGASFTHGLRLNYNGTYLLLLSNDLEPGDVVVFDVAKRLVTVNGLNARQFLEIGSSWKGFELQPGAFEMTTEPAEGLIINVSYRERWK